MTSGFLVLVIGPGPRPGEIADRVRAVLTAEVTVAAVPDAASARARAADARVPLIVLCAKEVDVDERADELFADGLFPEASLLILTTRDVHDDLAGLLVHAADIFAYLRRGQVAMLLPARTGGGDHSVKAVLAGRTPMVFGGRRYMRRESCETQVKTMQTREVAVDGGWRIVRQWRIVRLSMRTTGIVACFDRANDGTVTA